MAECIFLKSVSWYEDPSKTFLPISATTAPNSTVAEKLLQQAEVAIQAGAELEVLRFCNDQKTSDARNCLAGS